MVLVRWFCLILHAFTTLLEYTKLLLHYEGERTMFTNSIIVLELCWRHATFVFLCELRMPRNGTCH